MLEVLDPHRPPEFRADAAASVTPSPRASGIVTRAIAAGMLGRRDLPLGSHERMGCHVTESTSISRVLRHPAASAESLESIALLLGAAFFAVGGVVSFVAFWGTTSRSPGPGRSGSTSASAGGDGADPFVPGRRPDRQAPAPSRYSTTHRPARRARRAPALVRRSGLASRTPYRAARVDRPWPTCSSRASSAPSCSRSRARSSRASPSPSPPTTFLSSVHLTPMLLSLVLAAFLVVGALAAMLSAGDPQWWKKNLSALGMSDAASRWPSTSRSSSRVPWSRSSPGTPRRRCRRRPRRSSRPHHPARGAGPDRHLPRLRGIFPVDEFLSVHNTVATGMAVIFAVIVIGLRWLVPAMPRVFVLLGYAYVGVIVVLGIFFAIGYYNLTAVELVAGCAHLQLDHRVPPEHGHDAYRRSRRHRLKRTCGRGRMPHPTPSRCRARRSTPSARAPSS